MRLDACNEAQKAAILLRDRDLLVTAGAGTGKTTVLVERVLQHLREGSVRSLSELLVVTFTEKAAREMRERIYLALREESGLRRFLPELPRAPISTIHAFCARFLREHCLEAGLEPGFRVLEETGATEAMEEALSQVFHRWYVKPDGGEGDEFRGLVEMAGFDETGERLRQIVRRLYAYARTTEDPEGYLAGLRDRPSATRGDDLPWWGELQARAWGVRNGTGSGAGGGGPRAAAHGPGEEGAWPRGLRLYASAIALANAAGKKTAKMEELLTVLRSVPAAELATPGGRERMRAALVAAGVSDPKHHPLGIGFPRAATGAPAIPGFETLHAGARKSLNEDRLLVLAQRSEDELLQEERRQRHSLAVLIDLARELDASYGAFKRRHGLLDFSDLELFAARILRASGGQFQGSYREVLIDEFQDVNGLQNDILDRVSTRQGRFRVGDVKQSIYQFRLADPTIFLRLQRGRPAVRRIEDVPADPVPVCVLLAENHRSRPPVLRFANAVAAPLLGPEEIGTPYDQQALVPGRADDPAGGAIELQLLRRTKGDDERPARRQAQWVARRIERLIGAERPSLPRRAGPDTPARYRDVAILLRRSANAPVFLEALQERGIPAYLGAGGSLLEDEAVRDFRCLLQAIDNPRDDIALAALLRSPLFGLSDDDLLRVRLAWPGAKAFIDAITACAGDGGWNDGSFQPEGLVDALRGAPAADAAELVPPRLAGRLGEILTRLRAWRRRQGGVELGRFLEELRRETGFDTLARAAGDGPAHAASLARLFELARAWEEERGPSLHGFLARIESMEQSRSLDAVPVNVEGDDAVAVLTMHKAKGLEFPIVVIPELEWNGNPGTLGNRVRLGRDWAGVRRLDPEAWVRTDSAARCVLERMQAQAERAEEARILYVALTRARERMILVGTPTSKEGLQPLPPSPHALEIIQERVRTAKSDLGWILAALSAPGVDLGTIPARAEELVVDAESFADPDVADEPGTTTDPAPPAREKGKRPDLATAAVRLGPSSAEAIVRLETLLERVTAMPGHAPLATLEGLRGKYWVTELKSLADAERQRALEEEGAGLAGAGAEPGGDAREDGSGSDAGKAASSSLGAEAAARRGIAYHAALARCDLAATDAEGIERQFASFAQAPWWGEAGRDAALERGLVRFFASELGERLRAAARSGAPIEREVPFSLRLSVRDLMPLLPPLRRAIEADPRWHDGPWARALEEAWAVVQGRIDCVFEERGLWHLLDWKTDRGSMALLADRAQGYAWQMRIYEQAVRRLWGGEGETWLAFVAAGIALPVAVEE